MNQCHECDRPIAEHAVFCDDCIFIDEFLAAAAAVPTSQPPEPRRLALVEPASAMPRLRRADAVGVGTATTTTGAAEGLVHGECEVAPVVVLDARRKNARRRRGKSTMTGAPNSPVA